MVGVVATVEPGMGDPGRGQVVSAPNSSGNRSWLACQAYPHLVVGNPKCLHGEEVVQGHRLMGSTPSHLPEAPSLTVVSGLDTPSMVADALVQQRRRCLGGRCVHEPFRAQDPYTRLRSSLLNARAGGRWRPVAGSDQR